MRRVLGVEKASEESGGGGFLKIFGLQRGTFVPLVKCSL